MLPASQYKPGSPPPPHLSPFVDNKLEGYIPKRQEEINELKGITEEVYEPDIDEDEEFDNSKPMPINKDLDPEDQGAENNKFDDESSGSDDEDVKQKKQQKSKAKNKLKESLEKERKELGKLLMTKRQRRLYTRINYSLRRKREFVNKLKEKRMKLEKAANK